MPDGFEKKTSAKVRTTLTVDAALRDFARDAGLNLSATLETALRHERRRRWAEENRAAIDAYNREIAERGVWGEEFRRF